MNHRRKLLAAAAALALARAGAALAQPAAQPKGGGTPVVIGWLVVQSRESTGHFLAAFRAGMAALGWKEGVQFVIEERWANGQYDRLPLLAAELAAKRPALIVAAPSQSVAAAAKAAPRTPIVHATGSDPVAAGFAVSLARPGGMITGLSNVATDVAEKYLELLLEAVPKVKRVGFLIDAASVNYRLQMQAVARSAAHRSIDARVAELARADEIEAAMARLAKEGAQALAVFPSPLFTNERQRICTLALAHRWVMIGASREFAEAGAMLSYGANPATNFRRAAYYVDRILKGAKPGDLPIEQPMTIEMLINGKTAKKLGITLSQSLLIRADKVIE